MQVPVAPEGRFIAALAVSVKTGLLFWFIVALNTPGGEPWDAGGFWSVTYPLALLTSAALGFAFPARAWLWGLVVMLAQVPVVVVMSGVGPLLLAGLVYAIVLAVPAVAVSWLAGAARTRMGRPRRR